MKKFIASLNVLVFISILIVTVHPQDNNSTVQSQAIPQNQTKSDTERISTLETK